MKEKAHSIFQDLLEKKPSIYEQIWKGKPFEKIKYIATTEKGDLGEDFLERSCAKRPRALFIFS